jgi:hypothetical protein
MILAGTRPGNAGCPVCVPEHPYSTQRRKEREEISFTAVLLIPFPPGEGQREGHRIRITLNLTDNSIYVYGTAVNSFIK